MSSPEKSSIAQWYSLTKKKKFNKCSDNDIHSYKNLASGTNGSESLYVAMARK